MSSRNDVTSLEELLERLKEAEPETDRIQIGAMLEAAGTSSFGPLLVMTGLLAVSPASGIPGVPTIVAVMVLLTAGQVLCGRKHFWLPGWIVRRSFSRKNYEKILMRMRRSARFLDRFFRPRLTLLTHRAGAYAIAFVCTLIALVMPLMEIVPFAATTAGAAITAFGLALIARDGLMTALALIFTLGTATIFIRSTF